MWYCRFRLAECFSGSYGLGVIEDPRMSEKVVANLATGLEDAERVTVAFLVAAPSVSRPASSTTKPS